MEDDNISKDGQIEPERTVWVEDAQSPQPAINDTCGFENRPSSIRRDN